MPTKVWKCNHCSKIFNSQEEALTHEAQCGCNEATKMCNTCQFYEEMGYPIGGSVLQCRNKQSPLYDQTVSVFMEDKNVEDFFSMSLLGKRNMVRSKQ